MRPGRAPSRTASPRTRRDAHLRVGVLDVAIGGLDGNPKLECHLLGLQAARQHADHLSLARGETRRALDGRNLQTGRLDNGGRGIGIDPAGGGFRPKRRGRLFGRQRSSVRPRLAHRVVGVGGGEKTSRHR